MPYVRLRPCFLQTNAILINFNLDLEREQFEREQLNAITKALRLVELC